MVRGRKESRFVWEIRNPKPRQIPYVPTDNDRSVQAIGVRRGLKWQKQLSTHPMIMQVGDRNSVDNALTEVVVLVPILVSFAYDEL